MKQGEVKTKQIVELVIALLVFLIAAYFIYQLLSPKSSSKSSGETVTVVTPLTTTFDSNTLQDLSDNNKSRDFYSPPDLKSGLNNPQPFGQ